MARYQCDLEGSRFVFPTLREVLAAASPRRSGAELAGVAAQGDAARVAARFILADLPLRTFLEDLVVPYEDDEITRPIVDTHDVAAFARVAHMTVGGLRGGLSCAEAAQKLAWLVHEALRRKFTGVGLKDDVQPRLLPT